MNNNQTIDLRGLQDLQAELLYSETEEKTDNDSPEPQYIGLSELSNQLYVETLEDSY